MQCSKKQPKLHVQQMENQPLSRYGISAVQYDSQNHRITNVQAYRLSPDDKLSGLGVYPREAVIDAIEEKGLTLVTLPTAFDGKYTVGSPIIVVEVQQEKFLKLADGSSDLAADEIGLLSKF